MAQTAPKATPTPSVVASPAPKPSAAALTLDKLPTLAERIKASIAHLRWHLGVPEQALLKRARALTEIESAEQAEDVGRDLVAIKRVRRAGETHYELLKRPFNAVRTLILGWESADVEPWERAEKKLDKAIVAWRREQQRRDAERQAEEQRKADEAAQAEHTRQVQALEAVAEQSADPEIRDALQVEAAQLAQAPVVAPQVQVESSVPYVPGLGFTRRYAVEIQGDAKLRAFLKAVSAKNSPLPIVAALGLRLADDDEGNVRSGIYTSAWLNDQARASDGDVRYPGVTVVVIEGTRGR